MANISKFTISKFTINGEWVTPKSKNAFELINPADESHTATYHPHGQRKGRKRHFRGRELCFEWSMTRMEERLNLLKQLIELNNDNCHEIAELMTKEMGATIGISKDAHAWVVNTYPENAIAALEKEEFEELCGSTVILKEPIGVCTPIAPRNWPLNWLVANAAPALAAGCTMVAKPSEYSPLPSIRSAELVQEAGYPAGVYNHISGTGDVAGEALSRHPDEAMDSVGGWRRW